MEAETASDQLVGVMTRLSVRYPTLIRQVCRSPLTVELTFYVEDLALECAQAFLDAGITAVHRLDQARVVSLQIPSLLAQGHCEQAVAVLEVFLAACRTRAEGRGASQQAH
ncbi:MAG: hypothetical protein GX605_10630 [Chloroflexi bacterium]|nr:hypothetical protein [Chloroflexota bacterium]